jgi:hypothetical protein
MQGQHLNAGRFLEQLTAGVHLASVLHGLSPAAAGQDHALQQEDVFCLSLFELVLAIEDERERLSVAEELGRFGLAATDCPFVDGLCRNFVPFQTILEKNDLVRQLGPASKFTNMVRSLWISLVIIYIEFFND